MDASLMTLEELLELAVNARARLKAADAAVARAENARAVARTVFHGALQAYVAVGTAPPAAPQVVAE